MGRELKNIPASIFAKLRNFAKENMFTMESVLQRFANERFLYRLSQSKNKESFILKGGMMLIAQKVNLRRPTRDIDIRSIQDLDLEDLRDVVKSICVIDHVEDGLIFDPDTVKGELMRVHQGVVIQFIGLLGDTQIRMRLDISYEEVETVPKPIMRKMPTILNHSSPELLCYKFETTIAEKIETAVSRGDANRRYKDFYDIWLIISYEKISRKDLIETFESVFSYRGTDMPRDFSSVISDDFIKNSEVNWETYKLSGDYSDVPSFAETFKIIEDFINPYFYELIS